MRGAIVTGVVLTLAALALAASRLYLGVHDLGDVIGGLAIGFLAGAVALKIGRRS